MNKILVGEIEGRVFEINGEWSLKVGDSEDDIEYLQEWLINNAPEGKYVIITIAVLEGV